MPKMDNLMHSSFFFNVDHILRETFHNNDKILKMNYSADRKGFIISLIHLRLFASIYVYIYLLYLSDRDI